MAAAPLDEVDRDILYSLQQDGNQSAANIASALDVTEDAVRGRIDDLERRGVLQRYTVDVDYARAGVQHYFQFVCTARVSEREALVQEARQITGVVRVVSLMTGKCNVIVEAAASSKDEITDVAWDLDRAGLRVEREHLVREEVNQPYGGFQTAPRR